MTRRLLVWATATACWMGGCAVLHDRADEASPEAEGKGGPEFRVHPAQLLSDASQECPQDWQVVTVEGESGVRRYAVASEPLLVAAHVAEVVTDPQAGSLTMSLTADGSRVLNEYTRQASGHWRRVGVYFRTRWVGFPMVQTQSSGARLMLVGLTPEEKKVATDIWPGP